MITQALDELYDLRKPYNVVQVPVPLELTPVIPTQVSSSGECSGARVGFLLTGPGLGNDGWVSALVSKWAIYADGSWVGVAGGSYSVQIWDTAMSRTDVPPAPASGGLDPICEHAIQHPEVKWMVHVVYQIQFKVDGKEYWHSVTNLTPGGKGETAYFFQVEKAY